MTGTAAAFARVGLVALGIVGMTLSVTTAAATLEKLLLLLANVQDGRLALQTTIELYSEVGVDVHGVRVAEGQADRFSD